MCVLIAALVLTSSASTLAAPPHYAPFRYYEQTGHNVGGAFLEFYDANGGVQTFGLPLSEAFLDSDSGLTVQYFEHVRLEWHPDAASSGTIVVADLGKLLTANRDERAFDPQAYMLTETTMIELDDGGTRFSSQRAPASFEPFYTFWKEQGGTALFGKPVSAPVLETIDDSYLLVQYFEHVRLEQHPGSGDNPGTVQVGALGREALAEHPDAVALLEPAAPIVELAAATTPYYGSSSTDGQNILLAARMLDGMVIPPDTTASFLDQVGPLTVGTGYVEGQGIINGEIALMLAGGICQVSAALYESALSSGMEIVERHSHSFVLGFFADQPGLEAAVYEGGDNQDLRWHNNTGAPVYIATSVNSSNATVRVALWGVDDGRTVNVSAPQILRVYGVDAERIEDDTLEPGAEEEESPGADGMDVLVHREVRDAAGNVLISESITTSYAPVAARIRFSPEEATPTPSPTPMQVIEESAPAEPVIAPTVAPLPAAPAVEEVAPVPDVAPVPIEEPAPNPNLDPVGGDPAPAPDPIAPINP
jgi:hypothetical protein